MPLERLKPRFFEKVWGSAHLEPWFRNTGARIGEVWFEGAADSPLLIKFLFTTEKLSVQVHPDDAYAAQHHPGSRGKTEMWHVLAADPGARIAAGLREPVSAERLRAAALSGEIEDLLQWHPAQAGDTFFIPAGTIHTIGAGLVLCEVQQNSDLTYRLYDYGRPRELHLDHALAVARREPASPRQPRDRDLLLSCDYFSVRRSAPASAQGPQLIIVTDGLGTVAGQPVRPGEVFSSPGPLQIERSLSILHIVREGEMH